MGIKYLGVVLDPKLSYGPHVNYLCKKIGKKQNKCKYFVLNVNKGLYMLKELGWLSVRQSIKTNTLLTIYKIQNYKVPPYLKIFKNKTWTYA